MKTGIEGLPNTLLIFFAKRAIPRSEPEKNFQNKVAPTKINPRKLLKNLCKEK